MLLGASSSYRALQSGRYRSTYSTSETCFEQKLYKLCDSKFAYILTSKGLATLSMSGRLVSAATGVARESDQRLVLETIMVSGLTVVLESRPTFKPLQVIFANFTSDIYPYQLYDSS